MIEKHDPGENDLYVRALELAQVSEDDYFSHVVNKDIDGIMRDIQDAHRKDLLTADEEISAMEAQKQLETAMSDAGSENEKKACVFLASLGIDYDVLLQEEFVTVINVLKKSVHMKSPFRQRGKVPYPPHGKGKRKKR